MHPLIGNLTELTDKELTEKLTKIMKVMRTAGMFNAQAYNQAYMIYQSLQEEQLRRLAKLSEEQSKLANTSEFDSIINIG